MQDELVAGTSLEAIKHEEYWRQVELDSSSQRQAESSGVGPRSEMGQEALNSNSNFTTILAALLLQPAFQGKRGWRRDCCLLQYWEVGIQIV